MRAYLKKLRMVSNMKDIAKMDFDSVVKFINDGAEGKVEALSDEEAIKFEGRVVELFSEAEDEKILNSLAKISEMNILKMNAHFFDNLPDIWAIIQNGIEIVAKSAEA